jgi:hypothetical protein
VKVEKEIEKDGMWRRRKKRMDCGEGERKGWNVEKEKEKDGMWRRKKMMESGEGERKGWNVEREKKKQERIRKIIECLGDNAES